MTTGNYCDCGHLDYRHKLFSCVGNPASTFHCELCQCTKFCAQFSEPKAVNNKKEENSVHGYHVSKITKGAIGEISKIEEEFAEFLDAKQQGCQLMQLLELSDLIGAIEAWLHKHHQNISLTDLIKMKDITVRAFKNGHRK